MTRTPLPDAFPQLEFRTALDTADVSAPLLVAAVSLRKLESTLGHPSAEVEATFTLTFSAADFSDDESAALVEAVDAALAAKLTPALLDAEAEELGVHVAFRAFRWNETSVPSPGADGTLSVDFVFVGKIESLSPLN